MNHQKQSCRPSLHQFLDSERRRRLAMVRRLLPSLAGAGGVLTLGFAAAPAEALVVDNQTIPSNVFLTTSESLQVTSTGVINVLSGDSVANGAPGLIGSIGNAGRIVSPDGSGIALLGADVQGDMNNDGEMQSLATSIFLSSSTVSGAITNSTMGVISSNDGDGIRLGFSSAVAGGIHNQGTINAGQDGIDLSGGSSANGHITNSGSMVAGDDGIEVKTSSSVSGAVQNSGSISAGDNGIVISSDSEVVAGLYNGSGGTITAGANGIFVSWDVSVSSITNAGTIEGGDSSISVASSAFVGTGITNTGVLIGRLTIDGSNNAFGGIDLDNSGTLNLGATSSRISGDFTQSPGGKLSLTLMNFADYFVAPLFIGGDANLGGSLFLSFLGDFGLPNGQRFTLFDIDGSRGGMFANLSQNALIGYVRGERLMIDYTAEGNIELFIPEPGSLALLGMGALGWTAQRLSFGRKK